MTGISIVIPCYNEAGNAAKIVTSLGPVVEALSEQHAVDVVFVDDGSTDRTRDEFERVCGLFHARPGVTARVVVHERNRGLGAAIRTGLSAATGEVIVTTDSDATYRFEEIPALLARLGDDVDVVTASPYHPEGAVAGVPGYRLLLSRGSSWLYRRLVTRDIFTWTALFRAYRRRVVEKTPFRSDGFLAGTEILVNAVLAGYRAAEYPTTLYSRAVGTSKAKIARTIRAHLRFQAQILAVRLHLIGGPWSPTASRTRLWGTAAISSPALEQPGRC